MNKREECILRLQENRDRIQKEFGVTSLSLFGSMARGDNKSGSDIDLLVEMPPKIFMVSELKNYLEKILISSVDVIRRHSHMSSKFLNQISNDAIKIF